MSDNFLESRYFSYIRRALGAEAAQALIGHSDKAMTAHYSREATLALVNAIIQLSVITNRSRFSLHRNVVFVYGLLEVISPPAFKYAVFVKHHGGVVRIYRTVNAAMYALGHCGAVEPY